MLDFKFKESEMNEISSRALDNIEKHPPTDRVVLTSSAKEKENVSSDYHIQPAGTETSSEVQDAWNEQMAIISDVITKLNMTPPQIVPSDLDDLVGALKDLKTLAQEGITDEGGKTYYITKEMAQTLVAMSYQFSLLGITAELNTSAMSDTAKVNLLTAASNPTMDPAEDPLQVAVKNAASYINEDLGFQTYIYTTIMGIISGTASEFENLEEFLNQSNEILEELNDLIEISSYTNPPEVWESDLNLNNPGDIPPDSVSEIQKYIEDNDGNSEECGFQAAYDAEYDAAKARATQNGTTVEEEMHHAEEYPPYVDANGNRNNVKSSSDLLGEFVGFEGDPSRLQDIGIIMLEGEISELSNVPTAPDGKTMTEVGQEIWQTKEALEEQITALEGQEDIDQKMIDSLQAVVDGIDKLWTDALASHNPPLPSTLTPEEAIAQGHADVVAEFAVDYINYTQPGQQGATDLDKAVQRFQSWNEELQKDFQKIMTQLEMLVKFLGQILKMADDISDSYIKNYAS